MSAWTKLLVVDAFDRLCVDQGFFVDAIYNRYVYYIQDHGFMGEISKLRLLEAFTFLGEDMARSKAFELVTSREVEELKLAGHLAYWLRRFNPINALRQYEPADTDADRARQKFLTDYGYQYIPFMIGFDLCAYTNSNTEGSTSYFEDYQLDADYKHVVSHFLKAKEVSPHAMFLIYKSLFFNPLQPKSSSAAQD